MSEADVRRIMETMNDDALLQAAQAPTDLSDDELAAALDVLADDGERFTTARSWPKRVIGAIPPPNPPQPLPSQSDAAAMATRTGKPSVPSAARAWCRSSRLVVTTVAVAGKCSTATLCRT